MRIASMLILSALVAGCGGAKTCKPSSNQLAGSFCVPDGGALANQPLTLQVVEACGGCERSATGCTATVSGTTVALSLDGELCTLPQGMACDAMCRISKFTCTVTLDAGTYSVTANGPSAQTLVVGATGATSCAAATP
jgi:hypothetical protein